MKTCVRFFRRLLFSLLLLQMFNVAFNFVSISNGDHHGLPFQLLLKSELSSDAMAGDLPPERSGSEAGKELVQENLESGLFASNPILCLPVESFFLWTRNEFSGYKDHVAEINPRPPKAV